MPWIRRGIAESVSCKSPPRTTRTWGGKRGFGRSAEAQPPWLTETDPARQKGARQKGLADDLQREVLTNVAHAPAGVTMQPSAWRADLEGVLSGVAKFWNVRQV